MSRIQIGIPCGNGSEFYANFLIRTIVRTVSDIDGVEFLIGISKPSIDRTLLDGASLGVRIRLIDCITDSIGGRGHRACLEGIFRHVESEYAMFVDCDSAFLESGWDRLLLERLNAKTAIVGAENPDKSFLRFPNAVMCMFVTRILKQATVSYLPAGYKVTPENCKTFGRKCGDTLNLDTGYEVPLKLKPLGYDGLALPTLKCGSPGIRFLTPDLNAEENQLDGVPIFSHIGESRCRSFDSDALTIAWCNRVEAWLGEKGL